MWACRGSRGGGCATFWAGANLFCQVCFFCDLMAISLDFFALVSETSYTSGPVGVVRDAPRRRRLEQQKARADDLLPYTNRPTSTVMTLRGGAEEGKGMKRVMSHEDIQTEAHGEQDTAEARYFAKDAVEGEHRSLYVQSFDVATSFCFVRHWAL